MNFPSRLSLSFRRLACTLVGLLSLCPRAQANVDPKKGRVTDMVVIPPLAPHPGSKIPSIMT